MFEGPWAVGHPEVSCPPGRLDLECIGFGYV